MDNVNISSWKPTVLASQHKKEVEPVSTKLFLASWCHLKNEKELSPRENTGKAFHLAFDAFIKSRLNLHNQDTNTVESLENDLEALEIIKDEFEQHAHLPIVTKYFIQKCISLLDLQYQLILLVIKVQVRNIPFLSDINLVKDAWRLVMDGEHHEHGIYHFENEMGYMAGMFQGLILMIDTLGTQCDANLYRQLHDAAVSGVHDHEAPYDAVLPGFRDDPEVSFKFTPNKTATNQGLAEFNVSEVQDWSWIVTDEETGSYFLVAQYPINLISDVYEQLQNNPLQRKVSDYDLFQSRRYIDMYLQHMTAALTCNDPQGKAMLMAQCREMRAKITEDFLGRDLESEIPGQKIQEACKNKADQIFNHYYEAVNRGIQFTDSSTPQRREVILTSIVQCCQRLFQYHLFSDGNTRTIIFLIMNKFLIENRFKPVVFKDPNVICMLSVAELVEAVKIAQNNFSGLACH